MKKLKMLAATAFAALVGVASLSMVQPASAISCPTGSYRSSANTLAECNVPKDENGKGLMPMVQVIINVVLSVLGIVAVIMIIFGGIQYTTSQGDPAKAAKAKNTIIYGVVGLVVALLAFAIVNFVLSSVWGGGDAGGGGSSSSSSSSSSTKTK